MSLWVNTQHLKYGGPADIFVKVNDTEELKFLLGLAKEKDIQVTVIGNGSNILVKDKGIRGIVVKLNFNEVIAKDETLEVGAGVLLSKIARVALENELTGMEFASRNSRQFWWSNIYECRSLWWTNRR